MNSKSIIKFIFIFSFIICNIFSNINTNSKFIKKFVKDYGFKARDRYTHEYNSALLEKTAYSLDKLEKDLINNKFNLKGRLIICGYEEQAFPSYYFRYKKAEINDEASSKNAKGWSLKLHNVFGFLTGFLFKDFNFYSKKCLPKKKTIIKHIDADHIEIFKDKTNIFQEDSFGPALNEMLPTQYKIIKKLKEEQYNEIFLELIKFWQIIYNNEVKIGNNKPAATQDILFSIEYAKHLIRSPLDYLKWYIGPDITYPIETSTVQTKEATIHAQNFVKIFAKNLKPIEKKPTIFIFCSFVDGVGKSTLLGNIKNYFKYKENVQNYERVDNSSSQLAEIYKLKENIFIADLPAQVSHFTYKPDGKVYVNIGREKTQKEIKKIYKYILQNKREFKKKYKQKLNNTKNIITKSGYFNPIINNKQNPELTLIKNIILTKKEDTNIWIPFKKDNNNYIFNKKNPREIRILTSLKTVQSEGLKNIEAEQMLFFKGLKLPLPYKIFVSDLINKLKKKDIENIVFVDFISMYPRSSRGNIRINYLIQQLNILDASFYSDLSLYRNFINDSELLYLLINDSYRSKISEAFKLEVFTRLSLFKLIDKRTKKYVIGIPLEKVTKKIQNEINNIPLEDIKTLEQEVNNKIYKETQKLKKIYGKTKHYINIQKLSFENLIFFSELLSDLFCNCIKNKNLNQLWQLPEIIKLQAQNIYNGSINKIVKSIANENLYAYYTFDPKCKDEQILTPFLRMLRSFWYAAITNLFYSKISSNENILIDNEIYNISPLFLKYGQDNKVYLVQNIFEEWGDAVPQESKKIQNIFHLKTNEKSDWVKINEKPYRLNWETLPTNYGLYAFDCNLSNFKNTLKTSCSFIVQKYQEKEGLDKIITTSKLYKKIKKSFIWKQEYKKLLKITKKGEKNNKLIKLNIRMGTQEQIPTMQLIIRLLATLEMILKDPEADIAIRPFNKKDFKSALKLFEKMTLPKHYGILFEENLFEDYNQVEPYPSWEAWETLNK